MASATEPAFDSTYDSRLIDIIRIQNTTSSDFTALEALDDEKVEPYGDILSELAYGRAVARSMPHFYWAKSAGAGAFWAQQPETFDWMTETWGTQKIHQTLDWPATGVDYDPTWGFRWTAKQAGDYLCPSYTTTTLTLDAWDYVLFYDKGGAGANCKMSTLPDVPATYPELFGNFNSQGGQGMTASTNGCQAYQWPYNIDTPCQFYTRTELDILKTLWLSNAKPWTSGMPYNGYPTYKNEWHPGESTPPSDSQMLTDFRAALLDPEMSELRGFLNHLFEPTNYAMPLPVEQTHGFCEDNVETNACLQAMRADPVNTATGALVEQQTDLSLPGLGVAFALERTYNSNAEVLEEDIDSPLGPKWRHAYQTSLEVDSFGNVTITATDGKKVRYAKDGSDYITPPGVRAVLTLASGVYHLTKSDGTKSLYDAATGRLTAMVDRHGNGLDFSYSAGLLDTITDEAGRVVEFSYASVPAGETTRTRLVAVELPDSRIVEYGYTDTEMAHLNSVTDVLGGETEFAYDSPVSAGALLTEITDANDVTVATNVYDDAGRVIQQTDAEAGVTTFDYDDASGAVVTTLPNGAVEKDLYSGNVLVSQTDGENHTTSYGYDDQLRRTSITDGRGVVTEMEYDSAGNLIETSIPSMSLTESTTYDSANNPLTVTDARGKVTTYTWTGGLLTEVEAPDGGTTTYAHNGDGQITSVTDPRGKTTTFDYDADGNLELSTSPTGAESEFTYDGSGRMLTSTDANGGVTTFVYDDAGRVVSRTDPLSRETTFTYDNVGNLLSTTDPEAGVTTVAYDDLYRPVSVTDPDNKTTLTEYDPVGNVVETTSPTGDVTTHVYDDARNLVSTVTARGNETGATAADFTWTFEYDQIGNRTKVIDPLEGETTTTYDGLSRPLTVTDPSGAVTEMTYDGEGNIVGLEDPNDEETTTTYDNVGRPLVTTSPEGRTTTRAYDLAGNIVSVSDGLGKTTTFTYDDDGRLASQVEARGNETGADPEDYRTTFTYDDAGQLLTATDPLGNTVTTTYDSAGNVLTTTDDNSQTTTYAYDDLDRITSITAPGSAVTSFTYDGRGNQLTRTDARGKTTTFTYDNASRRIGTELPTGEQVTVSYDAEGNPVETVTGRGNAALDPADGTISRSYDALGRLTGIDYGDATPDVTFTYDAAGRMTGMDDGPGAASYDYDDAGRLVEATRGSDSFFYAYDGDGLLTDRDQPGTFAIDYAYDAAGRIQSISAGGNTTTFGHDAAGRLVTTTLPSGTGYATTREYDRAGRLVAVENASGSSILSRFEQTLDGVGNPTRIDTTRGTTTTSEAFDYDGRNQLTMWCPGATDCVSPAASVAFAYDGTGNRTSQVRTGVSNPGTTTYAYDDSGRMTSATIGGVATLYSYDEDGNQVEAGSTDMAYDLANRMTSIDDGSSTTAFLYDGQGRRLRATTGPDQVRFVWDPLFANAEIAIERDENDQVLRRHIPGPGGTPLAFLEQGVNLGDHYLLPDLMGSTADMIDGSGVAQSRYAYEPFGQATETQLVGGAVANPVRFTGEYEDPSGQLHLRARQYDPATGRFNGADPVDRNLGESAYAYVDNRPGVMIDPSGQIPGWASAIGDFGRGTAVGTWNTGKGAVAGAWALRNTNLIDVGRDALNTCTGLYGTQGGGVYGVLACADHFNPGRQIKETAETAARLLAEGCYDELGQVIGPQMAAAMIPGGAVLGRVAPGMTRGAMASVRARIDYARAVGGPAQRGSFGFGGSRRSTRSERPSFIAEGQETFRLYHQTRNAAQRSRELFTENRDVYTTPTDLATRMRGTLLAGGGQFPEGMGVLIFEIKTADLLALRGGDWDPIWGILPPRGADWKWNAGYADIGQLVFTTKAGRNLLNDNFLMVDLLD